MHVVIDSNVLKFVTSFFISFSAFLHILTESRNVYWSRLEPSFSGGEAIKDCIVDIFAMDVKLSDFWAE